MLRRTSSLRRCNVNGTSGSSSPRVPSRGCLGYIPEAYIHALNPYPLRIRAEDAYHERIIRKRGEDISILSDNNCDIVSDPYPTYESQDTRIYQMIGLLAQAEFQQKAVDLSFHVPTIRRFMCKHVAATSGYPARPGRNRSITRHGPLALSAKYDTRFRMVLRTTVEKSGREPPGPRPLGCTHQM